MDCFNATKFVFAQTTLLFISLTLVTLTHTRHTMPVRILDVRLTKHHTSTADSHVAVSSEQTRDESNNKTLSPSISSSTAHRINSLDKSSTTGRDSSIVKPTDTLEHTSPLQHLHKLRHHKHKQRSRRQLKHGHHGRNTNRDGKAKTWKSCKTKSTFRYLTEAVDMFGNTVTVYPSVHIGKVAVDQYFYETFCDKEACECSGIDETRYSSSCETNYSFTYARVIQQGEIGWTKIMVRSGCSCVVREKQSPKWIVNIMDAI